MVYKKKFVHYGCPLINWFLGEMVIKNNQNINEDLSLEAPNVSAPKRGMILPFTPLSMSFENVNYYVDMPLVSIRFPFIFNTMVTS